MTSNYHTPIPEGAAANASTFNDPLGQMDEALSEALLVQMDGHIIQDEGVDLAQQQRIDFVGAGVTVTNSPPKTVVTIPGALAYALTGLSTATKAAITSADTILGAFGKLQAQITALPTDVLAYVLTGLSTATKAAITSADTILVALGKLQAQISAHFGANSAVHGSSSNPGAAAHLLETTSGGLLTLSSLTATTLIGTTVNSVSLENTAIGINAGESQDISSVSSLGLLMFYFYSGGGAKPALFFIGPGMSVVLSDTGSIYAGTNTAGKVCVYWNSTKHTVINNTAGAVTLNYVYFRGNNI